jgi:hypothetical protein
MSLFSSCLNMAERAQSNGDARPGISGKALVFTGFSAE